jgi:hypothetical protein
MGKTIAYLIGVFFAVLLLRATGLLDGIFNRGNLDERAKFWEETVTRETPTGTTKGAVDALVAHYGMSLECFHSSLTPPIAECLADDPSSKGGMSVHPAVLQLRFTFRSEKLEKFETRHHYLK